MSSVINIDENLVVVKTSSQSTTRSYLTTFKRWMNKAVIKLDLLAVFSFFGIIPMFVPLLSGDIDKNEADNEFYPIIYSFAIILAASCSFAFCLPLIIDTILDFIYIKSYNISHLNIRMFSLLSLSIVNAVTIINTQTRDMTYLVMRLDNLHVVLDFSMLGWLICSLDEYKCWTQNKVISMLFFLYLYCYGYAFYPLLSNVSQSIFLLIISNVSLFLAILILIFASSVWFRSFYKSRNANPSEEISFNDYYCVVIMLTVLGFSFSYILCRLVLPPLAYRISIFILRSIITLIICILPGRMFRLKNLQYEVDSEVKSRIVKYMSHEMRTPMSAICMGLDHLSSLIKSNANSTETLATVHELQMCCNESTDLLDNLLLYEKMSKSSFHIERTDELATSFLERALLFVSSETTKVKLNILTQSHPYGIELLQRAKLSVNQKALETQLLFIFRRCCVCAIPGSEVEIDIDFINTEETLRRGRRHVYVHPMRSQEISSRADIMRLTISVIKPLSVHERNCFEEKDINLHREARHSQAGFDLSVWILRKSLVVHDGRAGTMQKSGADYLYIELPFCEHSDPVTSTTVFLDNFRKVCASQQLPEIRVRRHLSAFQRKLNMLIVDDSAMNRKMIVNVMKTFNHSTIQAEDGSVAVELVSQSLCGKSQPIDVILLDNEMPIMRGRDAVKKMRDMGFTGIIVGVTGNALEEDVEDFKKMGANDVIIKPLTTTKFESIMKRYETVMFQ